MSESNFSASQLDAINAMPAEQRYDYFINQILELREVWGLASDDGWFVIPEDDEDGEQLPVWPHAELAQLWVEGELADCHPVAISFDDWMNTWLPGMDNDALLATVCPDRETDAIVVGAAELLEDIKNKIS